MVQDPARGAKVLNEFWGTARLGADCRRRRIESQVCSRDSAVADPLAYEALLVEGIGELERARSRLRPLRRPDSPPEWMQRPVALARLQRVCPRRNRCKGLVSEIALARHDSPNCGGRHLGFARALVGEMPHTLAALETGALSEWRATLIVRESACLECRGPADLGRSNVHRPVRIGRQGQQAN